MPDPVTYSSKIVVLSQLISAPLTATVEADFLAAEKFVAYVRKYGFEAPLKADNGKTKKADVDFGKLRMATFNTVDPLTRKTSTVSIPLLTMLPLPLLQVQDAHFDYDIHVIILDDKNLNDPPPLIEEPAPKKPNIRFEAALSTYGRDRKDKADSAPFLTANMKVSMNMRQADMPQGIANMLEILGGTVNSAEKEE